MAALCPGPPRRKITIYGWSTRCDWRKPDGSYCARVSTFVRMPEGLAPDVPLSLCTQHYRMESAR